METILIKRPLFNVSYCNEMAWLYPTNYQETFPINRNAQATENVNNCTISHTSKKFINVFPQSL